MHHATKILPKVIWDVLGSVSPLMHSLKQYYVFRETPKWLEYIINKI